MGATSPTYQSAETMSFRYDFNLLDYQSEERQFIEDHATNQPVVISTDQPMSLIHSQDSAPSILIALPLHLVYYILEFMVGLASIRISFHFRIGIGMQKLLAEGEIAIASQMEMEEIHSVRRS